jgi:hypothetical protein
MKWRRVFIDIRNKNKNNNKDILQLGFYLQHKYTERDKDKKHNFLDITEAQQQIKHRKVAV